MNLYEIKRPYHTILSLGYACPPAIHLRRKQLRSLSGPLDWSVSLCLNDVNRLLSSHFLGFMELPNMQPLEETHYFLNEGAPVFSNRNESEPVKAYFVKDTYSNVVSVHDFPIIPNQPWHFMYPTFKSKLQQRITKFMSHIATSPSLLFVRWSASYEQTLELKSVLSQLASGTFHILILEPAEGLAAIEQLHWGIENVCALRVPNTPNDEHMWDYILDGIELT